MQKILLLSLLLLAIPANPMEKLSREDRSQLKKHISCITYVVAYAGRASFAGQKSVDPCLRIESQALEKILEKNDISVPEEKTFDWLEALSKKLASH